MKKFSQNFYFGLSY